MQIAILEFEFWLGQSTVGMRRGPRMATQSSGRAMKSRSLDDEAGCLDEKIGALDMDFSMTNQCELRPSQSLPSQARLDTYSPLVQHIRLVYASTSTTHLA